MGIQLKESYRRAARTKNQEPYAEAPERPQLFTNGLGLLYSTITVAFSWDCSKQMKQTVYSIYCSYNKLFRTLFIHDTH